MRTLIDQQNLNSFGALNVKTAQKKRTQIHQKIFDFDDGQNTVFEFSLANKKSAF
jgi:hypothetical protein